MALSTEALIAQLHQQLRTNIQLPACLKIIGFMRRLDLYSEQVHTHTLCTKTHFAGNAHEFSQESRRVGSGHH